MSLPAKPCIKFSLIFYRLNKLFRSNSTITYSQFIKKDTVHSE